jgi:Protein of unknown function (DUF3489)
MSRTGRKRAFSSVHASKSLSNQKQTSKRPSKSRMETKQSRAIALLRSGKGATIDALMKTTGWQQHSVRGFLAGIVRKRLKLDLQSEVVGGRRFYRVTDSGTPSPSADRADRQQV